MILTQKIRIYPSYEQKSLLWVLSEKCRLIYNFALQERTENWNQNRSNPKEEREHIGYHEQSRALPSLKQKYPEYKWVYSKVLQTTLKKLDADFKSFFALRKKGDPQARTPRFKKRKHFFTLTYNQSGFKLLDTSIRFSHKHPSKTPLVFEIPAPLKPKGKVKQVELFHQNQRWFVSITYEEEVPEYVDNGLYQAFDLGVTQIVGVNLYGKSIQFRNRRADRYWAPKLAEVQSKRDHCKKFSNRWYRYNNTSKKMKSRMAHQLKDNQHKLSKQIIKHTKANTIIIGDLNVKQMAKKKKGTGNARKTKINKTLNHSVHNTGYMGRFAEFLTYKARKIGKRTIKTDESNTTKTCCMCGIRKKRSIFERTIICDCGNHIDRDLNSAINIMTHFLSNKKKYEFLSHQPSMNEVSFLNRWNGMLRHTDQLLPVSSCALVGNSLL